MHRTARAMVTVVLGLTAVLIPAVGSAADAGLSVTATTATLSPGGTSVVLEGTYSCGPFASGRPDRGVIDLSIQQRHAGRTVARSATWNPPSATAPPSPSRSP